MKVWLLQRSAGACLWRPAVRSRPCTASLPAGSAPCSQPATHQQGLAQPQPTLPSKMHHPQRAMTRLGSLFPGTKWLGGLQAYLPYLPSVAGSPFPMTVFDMSLGRASEAGVWTN